DPKHETRNPKPETRNPKPETRNPKPETQNSTPKPHTPQFEPHTPHPPPQTPNPKPQTRNAGRVHELKGGRARRPRQVISSPSFAARLLPHPPFDRLFPRPLLEPFIPACCGSTGKISHQELFNATS
ncbi:hypothetical protein T484DRAFT_3648963, partial [Baffinella frigidus]